MYRTVMVPTDGSELSRHAMPLALAVARPANAVVHLVAVLEPEFNAPIYGVPMSGPGWIAGAPVSSEATADMLAERRQTEETALRTFADRLAADAKVSVTAALLEGDVPGALRHYAERHGAGLIVMASHGRGGLGRALLGSVTDALVRSAPCPVLVARPHGELTHEHEPASFGHVLVPIDGSTESEAVVPHAADIAELTGARCTVLYVSTPEIMHGIAAPDALLDPDAVRESEEAEEARLERVADRVRVQSAAVETALLRVHNPAEAIVEYAGTHAVDLIAMTTRAEHGLARLFRGSTATTLLHRTRLPILLARADTPPA